ncbi:MAG: NAD(P)/FAD-dependent oxidoreductase [Calditrichaeota bacterium]|nr:NAD(P)/FAD-dependent oxidoreductase [Calditrichota bacterium]
MKDKTVHIIGAGPAGLIAAITLAKANYQAIVHEKNSEVGSRFNGDFQGLENWTSKEDALSFLKNMGIAVNFRCVPYQTGHFYGPNQKEIKIKVGRPLFYLIERGSGSGSFDQGLKQQALAAGVQFVWNDNVQKFPGEKTIVGTGPKAADVIAKGILFKTSHPDAYYGFVDDRLAPKGYVYLLVNNGKATFATCIFEDFRHSQDYFDRSLESLKKTLDIDIREPVSFGGFGNFFLSDSRHKNDKALYVGESAGFQDALWGFGIRYALLSGYLAAASIIIGGDYEKLIRQYILPAQKASLANRLLFDLFGNWGHQHLLNRLSRSDNVIHVLQKYYQLSLSKRLLFGMAKRWYHTRLIDKQCMHKDCDCVWCRCGRNENAGAVDLEKPLFLHNI